MDDEDLSMEENTPEINANVLSCNFYTETIFEQNSKALPYVLTKTLFAATLPHYEPALHSSVSLLSAAGTDYDTVIVIGPNHSGEGQSILVSDHTWRSVFGDISGNSDVAEVLLGAVDINATQNTEIVKEEWSTAVHMPYLKKYLPNASVVSVLLSRAAKTSELSALAKTIYAISEKKSVLVLCSVDFSHYQSPEEAEKRDIQTEKMIASGDLESLRQLRGENVDSPETVSVLLILAQLCDAKLTKTDHFSVTYQNGAKTEAGTYFIYTLFK